MKNFLAVFGHVNMDHIVGLPKLPDKNTSIEILSQEVYFGGTGANIARWAARLGVSTALAAFVGPDFPLDFERALADDGVDLSGLKKVAGYQSPTCWIMSDPGQDQVAIINQGPMRDMGNFDICEPVIESAGLVHIGTGRPEYYVKVMKLAKDMGKLVAFDPAQEIHYVYKPETFSELLGLSDIFFANQGELKKALEYTKKSAPEELLGHLGTLVLTKGKEGSQIITKDANYEIPAIQPEKQMDPTGAGDAYRAGFYAGLSRSLELDACGILGASAASFALENVGPQENIPGWKEVLARAEKHYRSDARSTSKVGLIT